MKTIKGSKNLNTVDGIVRRMDDTILLPEQKKKSIDLLDATMPYDSGLTNNQVRAAIRETRAKLNEIINILNIR